MAEKPYHYCFTGHFHLRDEYTSGDAKAINLGSWLDQPGYYEVTSSESKFYNLS